ncbi:ABC transporter ATP-binding protein [Actinomyces sp. 565]|uniref:ATP-binding cassette domain-containing protein n=1 Tax=Actinomyces sp. 565 TaxID=2057794 RepID=UPI0013A69C75|nr:ABC transporter ATP-binding protein [Actinomyces sp. 565]NDR52895.1 ABC transporter ATP-binding protein [Actinomyces sp. 565]
MSIEGLSVELCYARRGNFILDVSDLELPQGVTVLAGPNGAGKTTLLSVLAGRVRFARLHATLAAEPLEPSAVGLMPQSPQLPLDLRAREVLEHIAWLTGGSHTQARGRATNLLEEIGLSQDADKPVSKLSGGMHRRLAFAASNVTPAALLLLDEPTNDLDPLQRREILSLITKASRSRCVIVSTHALHDVLPVAQHVVVLDGGRVVHAGPVDDFLVRFAPDTRDGDEAYLACLDRAQAAA